MIRTSRRTLLKTGAAFAGASAVGLPAIVGAQTDKIKIGHLTPLTGFLGALGAYAQLGIRMAAEEINAAGGVMGRQLEIMSEDSVNPATAAGTSRTSSSCSFFTVASCHGIFLRTLGHSSIRRKPSSRIDSARIGSKALLPASISRWLNS